MANLHSIYRVHKHLRDVNEKAYEPEILAIGPYHHGKDNSKMMENHKLRYLESLLARNGQTLETYISAIRELENDARGCYAEPLSHLSPDEFTKMLVRDGCFIVELIKKFNDIKAREKNDPIFRMEWMMNSLQRDLLLFENQIPFFVLCKLFDLSVEPGQNDPLFEEPGKYDPLFVEPGQHPRLIDLVLKFWENLFPAGHPEWKRLLSSEKKEHDHLLGLIHQSYRPLFAAFPHIAGDNTLEGESFIINSATELTNANVKFQKEKYVYDALFYVLFVEGIIRMPTLTIEDRTECFFRNLIAYEHYFPDGKPNYVADYARVLNCLIDSPADVQILSEVGIINNLLGDDEVVANFVNQLTKTVSGPSRHFLYAATFKRINTYRRKPWNRAWAKLNRDYFSSPWAYATFFTASAIILFTMTQTLCSILQVLPSSK